MGAAPLKMVRKSLKVCFLLTEGLFTTEGLLIFTEGLFTTEGLLKGVNEPLLFLFQLKILRSLATPLGWKTRRPVAAAR